MAAAEEKCDSGACVCCAVVLIAAAVVIFLGVFFGMSRGPVYSVTVTGVAGLDDLSASRPALSPVFNLTVRIDNARNRENTECVEGLSAVAVAVSYDDARLSRGSVPQFCAGTTKVRERSARAWGQDIVLPAFLRDQLAGELAAGEAAVDVKITTPAKYYMGSDTVFVCSQAKIGGGPAPCRMESVYNQHGEPAEGSNG